LHCLETMHEYGNCNNISAGVLPFSRDKKEKMEALSCSVFYFPRGSLRLFRVPIAELFGSIDRMGPNSHWADPCDVDNS